MRLSSKIHALTLTAALVLVTSCGRDSASRPATINETSIIGNWTTGCNVNNANGVYESIQKVRITQNAVQIITTYYGHSNNDCSQVSEIDMHIHPYAVSGNYINLSNANTVKITFYDPLEVADVNTANLCQFSNWQVGVEKDVLTKTCIADYDFEAAEQLTYQFNGAVLLITDSHGNTINTTKE